MNFMVENCKSDLKFQLCSHNQRSQPGRKNGPRPARTSENRARDRPKPARNRKFGPRPENARARAVGQSGFFGNGKPAGLGRKFGTPGFRAFSGVRVISGRAGSGSLVTIIEIRSLLVVHFFYISFHSVRLFQYKLSTKRRRKLNHFWYHFHKNMKREATYMHVAQAHSVSHTHTYGHTNRICITHVDGCEHFKIALAVLTDK